MFKNQEIEQGLENRESNPSPIDLAKFNYSNFLEKKFNLEFSRHDYSDSREKIENKDNQKNSKNISGVVKKIEILQDTNIASMIFAIFKKKELVFTNMTYTETESKDQAWIKVEAAFDDKNRKFVEISCTTGFVINDLCPQKLLSTIVRIAIIELLEIADKNIYYWIVSKIVDSNSSFLEGKNYTKDQL